MMADEIKLIINNAIGLVKFNRPDSLNSMNENFGECLIKISQDIKANNSLRCIVFEGEGDHFCAGGDIKMFGQLLSLSPEKRRSHFQRFLSQLHMAILNFINLPIPIVAKVRGAAAGFGLSLVLCADIALASSDAKFTLAYNHIGLSPDGGSTFFLPRLLGIKKAKELAFLGNKFDSEEALQFGIINRVFSSESFEDESDKIINQISNGPTKALGLAKRLINQSLYNNPVNQLESETEFFSLSATTYDFEEGVRSFLEKRPPKFKGN